MSIYDTHVPESGSGLYLKLKDGDSVVLRIISEPAIFETENERDGKITISTRYAWVVWNHDAKMAQIMQQSATFFKSIANLAQKEVWGDPTMYDIEVSRSGSTTDTTYMVTANPPKSPMTEEMRQAATEIDLLEKLKASPYAKNVFMLSEFDKRPKEAPGPVATPQSVSAVQRGIGTLDGPVNLDDIPF